MRETRSGTPPWRRAATGPWAARESCAAHDVAEALSAHPQAEDHQRRGQPEQQEAEGGALFPVEARNELRIDLLGEPLRVLAAEQRRRQVIAQRQHEYDD